MIAYLKHTHIDKTKWDACIKESLNTSPFVYTWYLDAVCKNWDALILKDYEAVFPLVWNTKLNISYLYQPIFTRYLGVYSKNEPSGKLVNAFLDAIPNKFKYIEFSIQESTLLKRSDFEIKERTFQTLDLNCDYEQLHESFKGDAKRNIKKAEKLGLAVTNKIEPKEVVDLFKYNKGKELKGLTNNDYECLEKLMTTSLSNDTGIILGIINTKNELIAGGFFIKSDNRILFLKGSANAEGKSAGAMYLLLNHLLKNYSSQIQLFDFGGSSVESVANFNRNFGATDNVYLQIKRNNLPFIIKLISGKK
ncbi:MAG: hypothetical protein JNL69_01535 [Bacteroidia bacterium]|nr:hypothetical protein [Bacteroidia bacterium]